MTDFATEVTEDTLYQGRVRLVQPKNGFRASTDSLLLASSVNLKPNDSALEIGCGCGGALLPAAWRNENARFTGVEMRPDMAKLASAGVASNGFSDRVSIVVNRIEDWVSEQENAFDFVFSNPPFFEPGKISDPGKGREEAYLETIPLRDWLKAMVFAVKPRAPIVVIHRAAELARLLEPLNKWCGDIAVLPVSPIPDAPANRVIVRARKGLKRGEVKLLAPLALRSEKGGNFTDRMVAIQSGGKIDFS